MYQSLLFSDCKKNNGVEGKIDFEPFDYIIFSNLEKINEVQEKFEYALVETENMEGREMDFKL